MTDPVRCAKGLFNGSWPEIEPGTFATAHFKVPGRHHGKRSMHRLV